MKWKNKILELVGSLLLLGTSSCHYNCLDNIDARKVVVGLRKELGVPLHDNYFEDDTIEDLAAKMRKRFKIPIRSNNSNCDPVDYELHDKPRSGPFVDVGSLEGKIEDDRIVEDVTVEAKVERVKEEKKEEIIVTEIRSDFVPPGHLSNVKKVSLWKNNRVLRSFKKSYLTESLAFYRENPTSRLSNIGDKNTEPSANTLFGGIYIVSKESLSNAPMLLYPLIRLAVVAGDVRCDVQELRKEVGDYVDYQFDRGKDTLIGYFFDPESIWTDILKGFRPTASIHGSVTDFRELDFNKCGLDLSLVNDGILERYGGSVSFGYTQDSGLGRYERTRDEKIVHHALVLQFTFR